MEKLNIVAYGDSNTYGYSPNGLRYSNRYSVVLDKLLGENYQVFEEGVVGRTTIYDDERPGKKGIDSVNNELSKYNKIDLLIIMLGTNDYKSKNARSIYDLEYGINTFLKKLKEIDSISKILLISPILLNEHIEDLDKDFNHSSYLLSKLASSVYRSIATKNNLLFMDAKKYAYPGEDGEHFTQDSHIKFGSALAKFIKEEVFN